MKEKKINNTINNYLTDGYAKINKNPPDFKLTSNNNQTVTRGACHTSKEKPKWDK